MLHKFSFIRINKCLVNKQANYNQGVNDIRYERMDLWYFSVRTIKRGGDRFHISPFVFECNLRVLFHGNVCSKLK